MLLGIAKIFWEERPQFWLNPRTPPPHPGWISQEMGQRENLAPLWQPRLLSSCGPAGEAVGGLASAGVEHHQRLVNLCGNCKGDR